MTGLDAHNALYRLAFRLQEARALNRGAHIHLIFELEEVQALADALAIAVTAPHMLVSEPTVSSERSAGDGE